MTWICRSPSLFQSICMCCMCDDNYVSIIIFLFIRFIYYIILCFMCLRYLSCARLVPEEVRKGNEIPQSWSCRGLWAAVWCQESNSGPLEEQWVMFCCWAVSPAFVSLVIDVFKLEIAFSWFLDLHNNVKGVVWWNKGRKISHFARGHLVPPVLRAYWSLVTSKRTKKWMDSSCSSDFTQPQ